MNEANHPVQIPTMTSSTTLSLMPTMIATLDIGMAERLVRLEKFAEEQDRFNREMLAAWKKTEEVRDKYNQEVVAALKKQAEEPMLMGLCQKLIPICQEARKRIALLGASWTPPEIVKPVEVKNAVQEALDMEKLKAMLPRRLQCEHLPALFEKEWEKKSREIYNEGVVFYRRGDVDRAIELWTSAIRIDRGNASAWNNRSVAHSDKGELDAAYHDYREAVKLGIEK